MAWLSTERLHRWQAIATIFSLVAVPVGVAIFGWRIQTGTAREAVAQQYVALAISILERPKVETDADLRKWAVAIVDRHAAVKLSPELKEGLEIGEVSVTARKIARPQLPPAPQRELEEFERLRKEKGQKDQLKN